MTRTEALLVRFDELFLAGLVAAVIGFGLAGCGGDPALRARYAAEVARCTANERAIVDRQGTTLEQDREDLEVERTRCDAALAAIGGAR